MLMGQGFSSKGNQSTQGQAGSSTSAPQESSTDATLKQILESQTRSEKNIGYELKNLHTKVDGSYNDLNNKFLQLSSHFKALENQIDLLETYQPWSNPGIPPRVPLPARAKKAGRQKLSNPCWSTQDDPARVDQRGLDDPRGRLRTTQRRTEADALELVENMAKSDSVYSGEHDRSN
ncbi:hypothetical protein F2Q70_00018283 [Brassica cretica]|uniref:Uncharacterized protein n=1 Tax=Brassica cretica TaxID=69181 RepID=A0A8S9HV32_BRACR|nr:hypothetical protein F2Q70_00018283 [Brassica cretica]